MAAPPVTALRRRRRKLPTAGYSRGLFIAACRAQSLLWVDDAKLELATTAGQLVRRIRDPYSAVEYAAPSDSARGTLQTDGAGRWWIACDGVNDGYDYVSGIDTAGYAKTRGIAVVLRTAIDTYDCLNSSPNFSSMFTRIGTNFWGSYFEGDRSSGQTLTVDTPYVLTFAGKVASGNWQCRRNGVTGNSIQIGGGSGSSSSLMYQKGTGRHVAGDFFGFAEYDAELSAGNLAAFESYLASLMS